MADGPLDDPEDDESPPATKNLLGDRLQKTFNQASIFANFAKQSMGGNQHNQQVKVANAATYAVKIYMDLTENPEPEVPVKVEMMKDSPVMSFLSTALRKFRAMPTVRKHTSGVSLVNLQVTECALRASTWVLPDGTIVDPTAPLTMPTDEYAPLPLQPVMPLQYGSSFLEQLLTLQVPMVNNGFVISLLRDPSTMRLRIDEEYLEKKKRLVQKEGRVRGKRIQTCINHLDTTELVLREDFQRAALIEFYRLYRPLFEKEATKRLLQLRSMLVDLRAEQRDDLSDRRFFNRQALRRAQIYSLECFEMAKRIYNIHMQQCQCIADACEYKQRQKAKLELWYSMLVEEGCEGERRVLKQRYAAWFFIAVDFEMMEDRGRIIIRRREARYWEDLWEEQVSSKEKVAERDAFYASARRDKKHRQRLAAIVGPMDSKIAANSRLASWEANGRRLREQAEEDHRREYKLKALKAWRPGDGKAVGDLPTGSAIPPLTPTTRVARVEELKKAEEVSRWSSTVPERMKAVADSTAAIQSARLRLAAQPRLFLDEALEAEQANLSPQVQQQGSPFAGSPMMGSLSPHRLHGRARPPQGGLSPIASPQSALSPSLRGQPRSQSVGSRPFGAGPSAASPPKSQQAPSPSWESPPAAAVGSPLGLGLGRAAFRERPATPLVAASDLFPAHITRGRP